MHNIETHPKVGLIIEPQTCLGYFSEFEGSGPHEFSASELCSGFVTRTLPLAIKLIQCPWFGLDSGFGIYLWIKSPMVWVGFRIWLWIKLHANVAWRFGP